MSVGISICVGAALFVLLIDMWQEILKCVGTLRYVYTPYGVIWVFRIILCLCAYQNAWVHFNMSAHCTTWMPVFQTVMPRRILKCPGAF